MPYKDKEQQRLAQQRHYLVNKNKYLESRKANRDKRDVWFRELKSSCNCKECNMQDSRCLDYHHKNPSTKSFGISDAVKWGYSEKKILEEISKCDVLCANCHAVKHRMPKGQRYRKSVAKNMEWLNEFKSKLKCRDCENENPLVLNFHHTGDKCQSVSQMAHTGYSVSALLEEIAKCDVICCNCHRVEHNGNVWSSDSNGSIV